MLSVRNSRSSVLFALIIFTVIAISGSGCHLIFRTLGGVWEQCEEVESLQEKLFNAFGFGWIFADYSREGQISLVTNYCFPSDQTFTKGADEISRNCFVEADAKSADSRFFWE